MDRQNLASEILIIFQSSIMIGSLDEGEIKSKGGLPEGG